MIRIRSAGCAMALAGAIWLAGVPAAGQAPGEISGRVVDRSGAGLAEVDVSLSDTSGIDALRRTDASGRYRFLGVEVGVFELEFRLPGFTPQTVSRVVVGEGPTAVGDVTLESANEYTVSVSVDTGTTSVMSRRASVSSSTPEARPGDEAVSEDTTVTTECDLAIEMSASVETVVAGTPMSYSVTVTNRGPSLARFVEVTDTLPPGVAFVSTRGCGEDPGGLPLCTLGSIAPGETASYSISVDVGAGTTGTLANQVSVNSQTAEIAPGDESASVETAVESRADLVMSRVAAPDPAEAGGKLSYRVTVTNNGPSDARQVVVEETLPEGTTLDATAGCAEDPTAVPTCSLGTIPAGGTREYTVDLVVDSGASGVLAGVGAVRSSTPEAAPGQERTTVETPVGARADLALAVVSPDSVVAGTQTSYAITVANRGPSDARDVAVALDLPPTVRLLSMAGCEAEADDPATCVLGTVEAGGERRLGATLRVDSAAVGVLRSRVETRSETPDASPGDESVERQTPIETRADLVVTARDSVDPAVAGRPLTYTVTVANNGPSDARDVVVEGDLPAGVTFRSTEGCVEDGGPLGGVERCTLGAIAAGGSKSFTVSVVVDPDATGVITKNAAATSSTTEDRPGDEAIPAPASRSGAAEPEPEAFVRRWADAWSARRVDDYLALYARAFVPPDGRSRAAWEALRRERINSRERIEVEVGGFETEMLGPDRVRVVFDQEYRSNVYSDSVRKVLELVREGGQWRIGAERVAP